MHEAVERVGQDRLWVTLERILALDAVDLETVLDQAAQIAAEALGADKVDAFVYEAETGSLVALGTSDTPMGRRQHAMGLDRLPLANGSERAGGPMPRSLAPPDASATLVMVRRPGQ
jgi:hypothetical protein